MAEEYGMKVWLELAVKNAKDIKKQVQGQLEGLNLEGLIGKTKAIGGQVNKARGMAEAAGGGAALTKLATTAGAILGVLFLMKKLQQAIVNQLAKSSPYLRGIFDVFGRAFSLFFRPFGDFLATLLRPLAVALLKLAVKWLKFSRTPAGEVTTKGGLGAMAGAPIGGAIGGVIGGIAGAAAGGVGAIPGAAVGTGVGMVVGAGVGAAIAVLEDAWQGAKNLAYVAKEWLDYLLCEVFGIDMNKVRVAVVEFIYVKIPEFFENIWEWLKSAGQDIWQGAKDMAGSMWDWMTDAGQALAGFASYVWDKVTSGVSNLWNTLSKWASWLWSKITTPLMNIYAKLRAFAQWAWEQITTGVGNLYSKLRDVAGWMWDEITSAFSNIWGKLSGVGIYLYNRITSSIKSAFSNFKFGWNWWWSKGGDDGHQTGLNFVPQDGWYKLHRGESVNNTTRANQGGGNTVIVKPVFNLGSTNTGFGSSFDLDTAARRAARLTEYELRRRHVI